MNNYKNNQPKQQPVHKVEKFCPKTNYVRADNSFQEDLQKAMYPRCLPCPCYCPEPVDYPCYQPADAIYPDFSAKNAEYPEFSAKPADYPEFMPKEVIYPKFVEKIVEIPICCPVPCGGECNICQQQMKYVVEQLIGIYTDDNWVINLDSGKTVTGAPDEIVTSVNKGLLYNEDKNEYSVICNISSITLTSAKYDSSIQYLPPPATEPICGCEYSIYQVFEGLSDENTVDINVGGQSTGNVSILANHIGIVVVQRGNNIEFINTCKIESFTVS